MLVIEPTKGRHLTNWADVNWTRAERVVKRLQGRIFRAAKHGEHAKVKNLQKLLARSASAKLMAIRKVTQQNRGKNTPGIDGKVCNTDQERVALFHEGLSLKNHRPDPVRRIFIPKKHGKGPRPLGIPTTKDRVLQTVVRLALEPEWESRFEANSFGFRPGRCTMDAICALHAALRRTTSSKWILNADISGCFDEIDHDALLSRLPVFTQIIRRWLKAGAVEMGKKERTEAGAPQGGPLSPLLMNITLDGMERLFGCENSRGNRISASEKKGLDRGITLVRYADDVIAVAPTKERIETYLLPKLEAFLAERGLSLSIKKTRIVHLNDRFDFLGFTFMRQGGRLLVKPSKANVKAHLKQVKTYLRRHRSSRAARVVQELNPVLRGWANYYRHANSKKIFSYCDARIWRMIWDWTLGRHPNKSKRWVKRRYFGWHKNHDWQFMENGALLVRHIDTPVTRFIKVPGKTSPMNPDEASYWKRRKKNRFIEASYAWGRRTMIKRQKGRCGMCGLPFEEDDPIDNHHIRARRKGGADVLDNLQLVHSWCHSAHHIRRSKTYQAARA